MVNPDQWYSVKEVGGHLGISRDTVIRQIEAGNLEAFKLPARSSKRKRVYRSRRVQGAELIRFIEAHKK